LVVFGGVSQVIGVFSRIYARWQWEEKRNTAEDERKRGAYLRDGIAQLGPVFVKIAQTLSTRPDIIGDEAADSLLVLQDQMGPFDSETAYAIIKEELQWEGPIVQDPAESNGPTPLFSELTAEPIAAASIGQVYKGKLMDGRQVAVKVQRPGMVSKIALDMYIVRQLLDWLEKSGFNGSEDLPIIVDEVRKPLLPP
jgi:predicted unusual protein kinase regulating ubiquinone biosynthesis (AarF/ABC1/UbiB family)